MLFISTSYGSDLEREKRIADEIVDAIIDGDAVFLEANNNEFLSITYYSTGTDDYIDNDETRLR